MGQESAFDELLARELVNASADGFIVTDANGTIVSINPAAAAMFGWAPKELIGEPVERLVPDDVQSAHAQSRERFAKEPTTRSGLALRGRRRDGSSFPVEISLSTIETSRGRLFLASVRDVTERQQMLDALQKSEQRVRDLVEQAPDGIFVADLEGRYTDVNSAACRMLGYSREELLGKTIEDLIPPADVPRLHELRRQRLAAPGSTGATEWVLRRKDGTELPVEVSATILPDGRWQAFIRDISTRKRGEETLRTAEERLRRAQRVAQLGSWEWDLETNEVYRSPELLRIYGLTEAPANAPELGVAALVPEAERAHLLAAIAEAARAGGSYELEHRIVRPDGEERIVLQQGEMIFRDGEAVRAVGATLDITQLRRAERERAAVHAELEAVLEECPVGITIVRGPHGEEMEANREARQMQGEPYDPRSGLAQYRGTLLGLDGTELAFDDYPALRALRGERVRQELAFRRPDGHELPIAVNAAPIVDAGGHVRSAVAVWEDLTNVKEIERLRAEWNSVVAHDLRQPINTINLYAQLLARAAEKSKSQGDAGGSWPADAITNVAEIRKMIARLTRMTNDLLDLSRLDASRLSVERRPLDLVVTVRESVAQAELSAPDRKFDLRTADDLPTVEADADRLAQIMENLLTNAVKYGRADAPIRVSVDRGEDHHAAVAVTSAGAHLKAQELERIFERFHRAGVAAHRAVPGIGLGLQITQGLVQAHGGRITATSVSGETTFRFTIPFARRD